MQEMPIDIAEKESEMDERTEDLWRGTESVDGSTNVKSKRILSLTT